MPALVITDLDVTLAQNPGAIALLGPWTQHPGRRRKRWARLLDSVNYIIEPRLCRT